MIIIGLNSHEINSSSAIIKNGKILFGSCEERFNRLKLYNQFPFKSISYFLNKNNLNLESIHSIAQSWNPSSYLTSFNPLLSSKRIKREDYFYTIPDNILRLTNKKRTEFIDNYVRMDFGNKKLPKFYFIQHHMAHAANSFFLSNFNESAILTCDFRGEFETTTMCTGKGNSIKKIKSFEMPDSLGMFYSAFTEYLGYKPDSDEWKVMALSAYKNKDKTYNKKIKKLFTLLPGGEVKFNKDYFRGNDQSKPNLYTPNFIKLFGKNDKYVNTKFSDWHISIASALQDASEKIALHFINWLQKKTKLKKLALGGGFFMNSVINGKILENSDFQELYIPYAPSDAGNSIGAALYLNHCIYNKPRNKINNSSLIGPTYSKKEIEKILINRKIKFTKSKQIKKDIANLIIKYGFVGYFSGSSEFGDRALCNRSILGDPRYEKIKNMINSSIKYRESFRPFAPVITKNEASKYFEVDKNYSCDYMEKVIKIKKKYAKKLAAICHADNSARLQTLEQRNNIFGALKEFEKITGYPIFLNTSLNVAGEPMVLSPEDAITTFYKSGLKVMIIEDYVIIK